MSEELDIGGPKLRPPRKPVAIGSDSDKKPVRYILHVGRKFTPTAKKDPKFRYVRYGNKVARRVHRLRARRQRSSVERNLTDVREAIAEVVSDATNSHQRRRLRVDPERRGSE